MDKIREANRKRVYPLLGEKAHNWKGADATDNVKRARVRRMPVSAMSQ
jgi:hypothetical protein